MIREAQRQDAYDIARIHVSTWRDAYDGIVPASYLNGLSVKKRQERWESMLSESTDGTLVITDERNDIIGWSSFGPSRDDDGTNTGELYAIYLQSDYWGKGYGRSLMKSSEDLIIGMGFSSITLWVLELNGQTRRFYENSGYQNDETEKQIEFDGVCLKELRYRKSTQIAACAAIRSTAYYGVNGHALTFTCNRYRIRSHEISIRQWQQLRFS